MNKLIALLLASGLIFTSCKKQEVDKENDSKETHQAEEEEGHHHDEEGKEEDGVNYNPEKGLELSEETQKAIEIKTQVVGKETFTPKLSNTFQIYRDASEESLDLSGFRKGFAYGTTFVSASSYLNEKSVGLVHLDNDQSLKARVFKVDRQSERYTGQLEVIVEIEDPQQHLKVGQATNIELTLPQQNEVILVPTSAVLKSATDGAIVYLKQDNAFKRVNVQTGFETNGQTLITSGLETGNEVVINGVKTLWLSELRAVKGGGHSH